jgi:hypothetical protein
MRSLIVLLTLSAGAALSQTAPPPDIDPQRVRDQDTESLEPQSPAEYYHLVTAWKATQEEEQSYAENT